MTSTHVSSNGASEVPGTPTGPDMKLEVVVIPVSDVDRAKAFYERARAGGSTPTSRPATTSASSSSRRRARRLDHLRHRRHSRRARLGDGLSSSSPTSRRRATSSPPAASTSARSSTTPAASSTTPGRRGARAGPAPEHADYGSFASFSDPDGNGWHAAGDHNAPAGPRDATDRDVQLRRRARERAARAAAAHGEHEKRTGEADADWPDWYAEYMVARAAPARSCRRERLRRHRDRRRLARRALRRRAGRGRPAGRARRARAGRRRVLLLGVHPVEDAAAPRRGGARRDDAAATAEVDVEAALAWRDFMVSDYSDAGQERWLAEQRHRPPPRQRPARRHRASSRSTACATPPTHVVLATGSDPSSRRSPACASSTASGPTARRPA